MQIRHDTISIRRAGDADRAALLLLALLDSAPALSGDVLIARVGDKPLAAMEVESGTTVADPFQRSDHLVELLELRAAGLRGARRRARGLWPRRRWAERAAEA